MADMSINPINTAQATVIAPKVEPKPIQTVEQKTRKVDTAAESAKREADKRAELNAREETATKEYGPVISRSSDGDTVRIKNSDDKDRAQDQNKIYDNSQIQSQNAANDKVKTEVQDFKLPETDTPAYEPPKPEYKPFEFPEELKDNTTDNTAKEQAAAASSKESNPAQTASMKNASEAELKRMYLQGNISQNAYNQELDSRAAREEAMKAAGGQFSSTVVEEAVEETENERSAEAIENLGAEDANESIPVEVRAQFVQNMDNM